ncbi:MAG: Carnitinyl-CoA dehydratase [Alphaproteobacteria bacterium MarineAlpha11_Bin1]|nr:MAG: Carnitinyl-CoA dehydratase [Alphaproteobacteria bacterium MarineAlpha11_Bin1]|tara:strand:- start:102 stop:827 length:726 start_codon:yes stop_codon:yes gene_type:complete
MSDDILLEQDGRILRATFNKMPDNGVSDSMARQFSEAILSAHENSDMVLLRSAGPDFCTGRVRDDSAGPPSPEAYSRRPEYDAIFGCYRSIKDAQVPVVTVVEGRCMGFGTAVTAVSDVSFASNTATFNIPEVDHNVMPTMVMSALYDRMSRNAILWMAYSTDFISAERALSYGLVSNVVDDDNLDAEVNRFCELLISRPRPAILGLKEYLHSAPRMDEQGAFDYARSIHSMVNTAAAMKK